MPERAATPRATSRCRAETAAALAPLRERIDAIDHEIVALLNERAQIALEIGRVKQETGRRTVRDAQARGGGPRAGDEHVGRALPGARARGPLPQADRGDAARPARPEAGRRGAGSRDRDAPGAGGRRPSAAPDPALSPARGDPARAARSRPGPPGPGPAPGRADHPLRARPRRATSTSATSSTRSTPGASPGRRAAGSSCGSRTTTASGAGARTRRALLDDLERLGLVPDVPPLAELRAGRSAYRQSDDPAPYEAAVGDPARAGARLRVHLRPRGPAGLARARLPRRLPVARAARGRPGRRAPGVARPTDEPRAPPVPTRGLRRPPPRARRPATPRPTAT